MDSDQLRTAVAELVLAGDLQELLNLYAGGDVALGPDDIARLYDSDALSSEDRQALDQIRAAIPDGLLPPLDRRATVPAEMVELVARCALERGKDGLAVRALREADSLAKFQRMYADFGLDSLQAGDGARAAFELSLAGRLGWALLSPDSRREFVTGLGVSAAELAAAVGAESARGRISGGRALPDFPAWQTYGPLLHARCQAGGCIADRDLQTTAPLAVRFLLHDADLAERAIQATGDALGLLRILANEMDPGLPQFAERHAQAMARYRELHEQKLIHDTRLKREEAESEEDAADAGEPEAEEEAPAEPAEEENGQPTDGEAPPPDAAEEDKTEAARQGLEEVQSLLLGRREREWRNCLAELAAKHPLSVFTVCTVRGYELGGFVIPSGEQATEFLKAVTG